MRHVQGKPFHIARFECLRILSLVLGLLLSPQLPAEPLGRLFFTPERRAALELQRQLDILTPRQETGRMLRLDGVVRRGSSMSNAKSTVWINGRPQRDDDVSSTIRIRLFAGQPDRADFSVGNEPPASLRVGETLNRASPKTADAKLRGQGQNGFRIAPR